ncbi:MAG: hypothetical protein COY40_04005 [Alphaproteobacteria bacterium CG_4_10_14_0_8_um_filter_53_9]|nr:MAG: hypothetical protein COY40_04005 [Alphaproteobacteria bacterium CG_4_10_14_0_8_um_filter_53_9]
MFMLFFVWLVLDTAHRESLLAKPLHMAGILACMGGCAYALAHMRKSDASLAALTAILPVAILLAGADIMAKILLTPPQGTPDIAHIAGGAIGWMLTTGLVASLASGLVLVVQKQPLSVSKPVFLKSVLFGVILLYSITVLLASITLAPNPGYVAAITMLSAVWLSLFAHLKGREQTNLTADITLIASALALTLLTH